ncbi:MAG: EAL domain-containing protein [Spirochaetota bacterium]
MMHGSKHSRISRRDILLVVRRSLLIIPVILVFLLAYERLADGFYSEVKQRLAGEQRSEASLLSMALNNLYSDFYADLELVYQADNFTFFLENREEGIEQLKQFFQRIGTTRPHLIEIRFIGADGHEVIRSERQGESLEAVQPNELRDVSATTYHQTVSSLEPGTVQVSPIERLEGSGPLVLRLAYPIHENGEYAGMLLINFSGEYIRDLLNRHLEIHDSAIDFGFISPNGEWMFKSSDGENFSYIADSAQKVRIDDKAPEVVTALRDAQSTVIETHEFMYYLQPFNPLQEIRTNLSDASRPYLVFVSMMPTKQIAQSQDNIILSYPELRWVLALVIYGIGFFIILFRWIRSSEYEVYQLGRLVADRSREGVLVTDRKKDIIYCNKALERISGYTMEELTGKRPTLLSIPGQAHLIGETSAREAQRGLGGSNISWEGLLWDKSKDGNIFLAHLTIYQLVNSRGRPMFYVGMYTDPTKFAYKLDDITAIEASIETRRRDQVPEAFIEKTLQVYEKNVVAIIRISNYEQFENYLLKGESYWLSGQVLKRLKHISQPESVIAAYDPATYVVTFRESDAYTYLDWVDQLFSQFAEPIDLGENSGQAEILCGLAKYPEHGRSARELLFKARMALASLLYAGTTSYLLYDQQLYDSIQRETLLVQLLPAALEREEIEVWFQPQIDTSSERICGAEALVRWYTQQVGFISPEEWIPLAEREGLIGQVTRFVTLQATQFLATLQRSPETKDSNFSVSINLSVHDLNGDYVRSLAIDELEKIGLEPSSLTIELTESAYMEHMEQAKQTLEQFRGSGFTIALDDFGTGFSSFSYLEHLHVDTLKIDKSFIANYPHKSDGTIIRAIIEMTHALGVKVVVEGVETETQLQFLKETGCDVVQGFYYSPAIRGEELLQLLISQRT